MSKNEGSASLIKTMSCDGKILRLFEKVKEPQFHIPEFEKELKEVMLTAHADKAVLLSRVTSVDDLQRQLQLTSMLQMHLDQTLELNFSIDGFHRKWSEVNRTALKIINSEYGDELNVYKDSTRTSILSAVLQPIEEGIELLDYYRKQGERIQGHLINMNWTLREVTGIIKEFLSQKRLSASSSSQTL